MQSQIVCGGCRHFLLYPRGASSVRCSVCSTINPVAPAMETAQLVCVGCRTLLMYPRGAASVMCACCHTSNDVRPVLLARVNCSQCHTTLEYPSGAPSVKCVVCQCITNIGMTSTMIPIPSFRPNGTMPSSSIPSTSAPTPIAHTQTVVVENPMTMDESGKLVGNVVVGVTTGKK